MSSDEEQIRHVVATWMEATRAGDVDTVLSLMTDDVVFLVPGLSVMRKADFAAAAKAQAGSGAPQFDAISDIQEIKVLGDWAYVWSRLAVTVTLPDGATVRRAGHTLSIFTKESGRWQLARDANLLTTLPSEDKELPMPPG